MRGNRLLGNNPKGVFDPEWEAGGAKVTRSTGVVFEDNDVAGNDGPGIWCDIDCRDLTVRGNRVSANRRAGIQVEISDGAEVTGNAVWENGWAKPTWGWGAGILVSSSRNVTVDDNVVAWNADGIVVVSQERDDAPGPTTNVRTSGNTVAAEAGFEAFALAWLQDWAGGITATAAGNGSSDDRFWISGPEGGDARFAWAESFTRLAPFAATPGGSGAAYLSDADLAARLEAAGIPVHPLGDHPLGRSGLRELLAPALGAGLALLLAVAGIVALAVRRRRPSSPIPPGPDAGPDAGPGPDPNPPTQEHP